MYVPPPLSEDPDLTRDSQTATVILGVTTPDQLKENLTAVPLLAKLTPDVLQKVEDIVGNKPRLEVRLLCFSGYDDRLHLR